jgi:hypothetical protein
VHFSGSDEGGGFHFVAGLDVTFGDDGADAGGQLG